MSGTLKVLISLALVGALASGVLAVLIVQKQSALTVEKEGIKNQLEQSKTDLTKASAEIKTKSDALTQKETELSEAASKAQALQTKLTDAEKKANELESSSKDADKKVQEAQAKLDQITKTLDGHSADELKSQAAKAQEELTAVRGEQRLLQDNLQTANAETARLQKLVRVAQGQDQVPPGLTGKIETVNRTWNFVVLNVGDKDGVVRNVTLIVYRDSTYVGKVKVVSTEEHTAVADILPEWSKGDIQSGDDVLN